MYLDYNSIFEVVTQRIHINPKGFSEIEPSVVLLFDRTSAYLDVSEARTFCHPEVSVSGKTPPQHKMLWRQRIQTAMSRLAFGPSCNYAG